MKYLLSTGATTTDQVTYVKDLIFINMKLIVDEVPYWEGGSYRRIGELTKDELANSLRDCVNKVISNVKMHTSLEVDVVDMQINYNTVDIEININGTKANYVVERKNL